MIKRIIPITFATTLTVILGISPASAEIASTPLFLSTKADPNVLLNLSVETPMGGAAYPDHANGGKCAGRVDDGGTVGTCYFPEDEYLGYFNPNACYVYSGSRFERSGPTNANHECSGQFSGNFLNWATMTAIDVFIWTMTGGNRLVDTAADTVIQRARRTSNNSWFPYKLITSTQNVTASTVTPFSNGKLYIYNDPEDYTVKFGSSYGGNENGTYNVQVKVCDPSVDLSSMEPYCVPYGSNYKPEGLIQENADNMRFALTSYSKDNTKDRHGGVLRSNMKYTGPTMPDGSGGTQTNSKAEFNAADRTLIDDPEGQAGSGGVDYSGIINYINKFSDYGYKSYDPISELFYESIRFFKNLGRTPEYADGLTDAEKGGFPVLTTWQDPIQSTCQKNFIVGINDAYPWLDKRLPGTHFTATTFNGYDLTAESDYGQPSNPDTDINVTSLTNDVGDKEGLTGTSQCIRCTANDCDEDPNFKTIPKLGEVFGICGGGSTSRANSYYIAGLAYYANKDDIRSDLTGEQNVTTFIIDTQEYNSTPLVGQPNMLWLTGKYGGFQDQNNNDEPDLQAEWDADGDGEPDNYVLASEPGKLVAGLRAAFEDVARLSASAGQVSANSSRLIADSVVYQTGFTSEVWSGRLESFDIAADGTISNTANWNAADQIPGSRKIFTYDPTAAAGSRGITFQWTAAINTNQQTALNTNIFGINDGAGEDRLDYLRGVRTLEGNPFREREGVLGDIINSVPWVVGHENYGYDILPGTEGSDYSAFRSSASGRPTMIYVGANDGMLHAFDSADGAEKFAYVPNAVFGNLSKLTSPKYAHQNYVDGSPRASDAYIGGYWRTMLVGSLGGGGRAIYALDVTAPGTFGTGDIKWEFTDLELGYTVGQPTIGRMANGKWAAIFGNGYQSDSQKAQLFIVDLEDGMVLKKIDTEAGSAASPNGLAAPIAVDTNGDAVVDAIYAGDLLGNLWKFDVDGNISGWKVAFKQGNTPQPLFVAQDANGNAQPITAKPEVGRHTDDGVMVYFGTGKYFETGDNVIGASPQVQTFYGIHDEGAAVTDNRASALLQQQIIVQTILNGFNVRATTNNEVTNQQGWFMDLIPPSPGSAEGERVVSTPLLRFGRIIFVTLIPEADPCGYGGTGWLMEMDGQTGSRLAQTPFDLDGDGAYIDEVVSDAGEDVALSGKQSTVGIIGTPNIMAGDGKDFKIVSGSSGKMESTKNSRTDLTGRQSWRELQ